MACPRRRARRPRRSPGPLAVCCWVVVEIWYPCGGGAGCFAVCSSRQTRSLLPACISSADSTFRGSRSAFFAVGAPHPVGRSRAPLAFGADNNKIDGGWEQCQRVCFFSVKGGAGLRAFLFSESDCLGQGLFIRGAMFADFG